MFFKICWYIYVIVSCAHVVYAQPLSCEEDVQCSEGYYCEIQNHRCYQCFQCSTWNRFTPEQYVLDSCIKSVDNCGLCFDGFINIYETDVKGKCVSPELSQFESKSYCLYVWMIAAIIASLIVVVFVYVLWNTYVFRIVPNCDPVSSVSVNVIPPKNPIKQILLIFKNVNDW